MLVFYALSFDIQKKGMGFIFSFFSNRYWHSVNKFNTILADCQVLFNNFIYFFLLAKLMNLKEIQLDN